MSEALLLQTERDGVVIRELTAADDAAYFESYAASRAAITAFDPNAPNKHLNIDDTRQAREEAGDKIRMGIWDGAEFVGSINAHPDNDGNIEVGYWTDSRQAGHGYATLAATALSAHMAKQHPRSDIYAVIDPTNAASERVLEKAGYQWTSKNAQDNTLRFDFRAADRPNFPINTGAYYDFLEQHYDYDAATADQAWSVNELLADILTTKQAAAIRTVLDIGAGTGQTIQAVLDMTNASHALGVDPSGGMLNKLEQKFQADPRVGVPIQMEAAEYLATELGQEKFDLITMMGTAEFVADLPAILTELGLRLTSGGVLVATFIPQTKPGVVAQTFRIAGPNVGFNEHYYSPATLEQAAQKAGLRVTTLAAFEAYERGAGTQTETVLYQTLVASRPKA